MRFAPTIPTHSRRRAFTLIEILVVVAIIIVLVGLTASAYFFWIGNTQTRNTERTIQTVDKVFQAQLSYVAAQARKESPSPYVVTAANFGTADPTGERRVLWIKLRLIEAFPITFAEINDSNDPVYKLLATAIPTSQRKNFNTYQRQTKSLKAANDPKTESSACLLTALTVNRGGSAITHDQLGPFVFDTDSDGVNEIIDGWRNPLLFYRFAWGSGPLPDAPNGIQGLNPAPVGSKNVALADTLDPGGLLLTWSNNNNPYRTAFETYVHVIANASGANYVRPVIVSTGPRTPVILELTLPPACAVNGLNTLPPPPPAPAADYIFSYNLKGN